MTFTGDLAWQNLDLVYRSSIAYQFARYALAIHYDLLPQEVVLIGVRVSFYLTG